jgi:hypothetical protein
MSKIETVVRILVDLLVREQYVAAEKATRARRLTAAQMSFAISSYGRTLIPPASDWWAMVQITSIDADGRTAFHVAAPLWTAEEGRSDLTLELRLTELPSRVYETELLDIHVL